MEWYWAAAISLAWLVLGFIWAYVDISNSQAQASKQGVDSGAYAGLAAFCATWVIAVTQWGLICFKSVPWYVWPVIVIGALGQVWSVPNLAIRVCRHKHELSVGEYALVLLLLVIWPLNLLARNGA